MKFSFPFLFFTMHSLYGLAQLNCKLSHTAEGETATCYHANGKKSTVIFKSKSEQRWFTLKIYDGSGRELYSREYGNKWGSSGVDLKYYKNGQVESARYTMQPDGGIQHYDVKTFWTEDGKYFREEDNSWGNDGLRCPGVVKTALPTVPPPAPKAETKQPNECAPVQTLFDFYIINNTSDSLTITCANRITFGKPLTKTADAGDTVKIETYYAEYGAASPLKFYKIDLKEEARKGYRFQIKHMEGSKDQTQYAAISLRRINK